MHKFIWHINSSAALHEFLNLLMLHVIIDLLFLEKVLRHVMHLGNQFLLFLIHCVHQRAGFEKVLPVFYVINSLFLFNAVFKLTLIVAQITLATL